MGLFKRQQEPQVIPVQGDRASVLVTGLHYKRDDLPRAFGQLGRLAEVDFTAVLRAMPPNEWNPTPIEVWVNGVHVGYVNDSDSVRYWQRLRSMRDLVSCDCVVKTTAIASATGYDIGKLRLSLPRQLA